jgi:hypothetical protein
MRCSASGTLPIAARRAAGRLAGSYRRLSRRLGPVQRVSIRRCRKKRAMPGRLRAARDFAVCTTALPYSSVTLPEESALAFTGGSRRARCCAATRKAQTAGRKMDPPRDEPGADQNVTLHGLSTRSLGRAAIRGEAREAMMTSAPYSRGRGREVVSVEPNASLADTVRLLASKRIGAALSSARSPHPRHHLRNAMSCAPGRARLRRAR